MGKQKEEDKTIYVVADKDTLVFTKDDIAQILTMNLAPVEKKLKDSLSHYMEKILKEVSAGAYDAAKAGHYWNKEMFQELMKETIYEMFFAQPEIHKKFQDLMEVSFKNIFEKWLTLSIDGLSVPESITRKEDFIKAMKKKI